MVTQLQENLQVSCLGRVFRRKALLNGRIFFQTGAPEVISKTGSLPHKTGGLEHMETASGHNNESREITSNLKKKNREIVRMVVKS